MKKKTTKKQRFALVLGIGLAIILPLIITGCPPEEEVAQFREDTANFDFEGNARSAKVQGTMLAAEWTGVVGKVETALDAAYEFAGGGVKGRFRTIFDDNIIVIVENTSAYKLKVIDGQFRTLYLSIDFLNAPDSQKIIEAVNAMTFQEEGYLSAKAGPAKADGVFIASPDYLQVVRSVFPVPQRQALLASPLLTTHE